MLRLRSFSSKFKPRSISSHSTHYTCSTTHDFSTHLCNSSTNPPFCHPQINPPITPNLFTPSGFPPKHPNSIYSLQSPNGSPFFHKFNFHTNQISLNHVFLDGHSLNWKKVGKFNGYGIGSSRVRSFCSESDRESINYDVVIVGAGPAGLSAAIRLKQLCREKDVDLSVCVVEKGAEVGAHILSGNVFEPRALDELLPQWKQEGAPIDVPVSSDKFWLLTKDRAISLPCPFDNKGNYVISLSQLACWLGEKAEELGVEIYPGFAASEFLYDDEKVIGIATNDMGIAKDGSRRDNFQCGVELKGRITLLGEGCRGSLSEKIMKKYNLREKVRGQHQTYALGIKEVWEIDSSKHEPGHVLHTLGWPLDNKTYGGSFLYHMKDRQVSLGLVVALNYHNPFLNPYEEFQKLKHHPAIKPLLEGATVLQYGARTLNEGGFQVTKMGSGAIAISLPFFCMLGLLASMTSTTMVRRKFAWLYATIQFALVVLFGHLFYSLLHVQAALSVLLATLARFGGTMSGTAILLETLKLRRQWQAWLNQQPSSQEVTQPHQLPETAYIPQINPPTETETVDSRIE